MKAGFFVVVAGVGMWMMVLGGLPGGLPSVDLLPWDRGDVAAEEREATPRPTPAPVRDTPSPTPQEEATPTATPTPEGNVHIVVAGDTMARIAQQYGVSLQALLAANPDIQDPARIEIGQRINIP